MSRSQLRCTPGATGLGTDDTGRPKSTAPVSVMVVSTITIT